MWDTEKLILILARCVGTQAWWSIDRQNLKDQFSSNSYSATVTILECWAVPDI
jgi:hypothetical protein